MTCIVGCVQNNTVYMGSDSASSDENHYLIQLPEPKVFSKYEKYLIGVAGSFRVSDILKTRLEDLIHPPKISDLDFLRTIFVDHLVDLFDNYYNVPAEENGDWRLLIGYNCNLYEISSDYAVFLCNGNLGHAIGSGEQPARGSLYSTLSFDDGLERLQLALEVAEYCCTSVTQPFHYERIG